MSDETEQVRQLSEDMLGLIDAAEGVVQNMFVKVCTAVEQRDAEIARLRERIAELEKQLGEKESPTISQYYRQALANPLDFN